MAQFSLETALARAETNTAMAPTVVTTAPDNFDLSVRQVTFGECVRTCESRGFKLTDLDPPMPEDDRVSDGGRQESPHPLEMLQVVSASHGYCMVRTVTRSGSNHYFVNAAFELGVCRRVPLSATECH